MLQYHSSLRQFQLIKWSSLIHSTMPYIHPRLDYRIEPQFSDCFLSLFLHLVTIGLPLICDYVVAVLYHSLLPRSLNNLHVKGEVLVSVQDSYMRHSELRIIKSILNRKFLTEWSD